MITTVVLDAMGVLYRHGNVVTNLLSPYLQRKGCSESPATVLTTYHACTRGELTTAELWSKLGVQDTANDTEYCAAHELTPGLIPLLKQLSAAGLRLACLTNDASEWSAVLRNRFGLDRYVKHWYVSAELGVRKPDPAAYTALIDGLGADPSTVLLVDDRGTNLLPAQALGLQTALFTSDDTDKHLIPVGIPRLHTMPELARLVAAK
ncbi:HAD-IA family hydrolase [Kribbella sp. NPDC056861]|uniref:HAD family hydrolase n=1 Tax=Kribbella sp. NPDC056861 TaxID=3154857 RepID=UPI00343980DA